MEARRGASGWPLAVAALGLATIASGTAIYFFHSARSLPGELAETGRQALRDARSIAEAFRTGTVTVSFRSYATQVTGTSYLQFATLRQLEIFERKDEATLLWGQLALPDVIVEARAPAEYTYYLDLSKDWSFRLASGVVEVRAPGIEFNTPAIDASQIRYEVREGSLFRNEAAALDKLKAGLTEMARLRARQNIPLVREVGRRKTEEFVERWLARSYDDASSRRVRVSFADERPGPAASERLR